MKSKMNLQFNLEREDSDPGVQDEDDIRLHLLMEEFRQDPEKMEALNEFIDEVLLKAQTEVDRKSGSKVVRCLLHVMVYPYHRANFTSSCFSCSGVTRINSAKVSCQNLER